MYDPALVPTMSKGAEYVWFHSSPHAVDSPEWHAYKRKVLAGRPVTIDLLNANWLRFDNHIGEENRRNQEHLEDGGQARTTPSRSCG